MGPGEFEHVVAAAAEVTGHDEFVVIGSQAILGSHAHPPESMLDLPALGRCAVARVGRQAVACRKLDTAARARGHSTIMPSGQVSLATRYSRNWASGSPVAVRVSTLVFRAGRHAVPLGGR